MILFLKLTMYAGKKQVRITLNKARDMYPKLREDEKDSKIWFKRTEDHALNGKKNQALWCLCVASCIIFHGDMERRKDRQDIIDQISHQFRAYGRIDEVFNTESF